MLIGLIILAAGALLLLQNLGIITAGFDIFWPVLIIILGLVIFIKAITGRKLWHNHHHHEDK